MGTSGCRVAVLASGSGSNFQALIDDLSIGGSDAKLVGLVSDQPHARALERARHHSIDTAVVPFGDFNERSAFDSALAKSTASFSPDLIILAGFMRIISGELIDDYAGRILNIHPALLPKYKGLHTHRRCLEAGDIRHGTTVHFVTAALDDGPSVVQACLDVRSHDTVDSLTQRVQKMEHRIYPMALRWFADNRLAMHGGQAILDGKALTTPVTFDEHELLAS